MADLPLTVLQNCLPIGDSLPDSNQTHAFHDRAAAVAAECNSTAFNVPSNEQTVMQEWVQCCNGGRSSSSRVEAGQLQFLRL